MSSPATPAALFPFAVPANAGRTPVSTGSMGDAAEAFAAALSQVTGKASALADNDAETADQPLDGDASTPEDLTAAFVATPQPASAEPLKIPVDFKSGTAKTIADQPSPALVGVKDAGAGTSKDVQDTPDIPGDVKPGTAKSVYVSSPVGKDGNSVDVSPQPAGPKDGQSTEVSPERPELKDGQSKDVSPEQPGAKDGRSVEVLPDRVVPKDGRSVEVSPDGLASKDGRSVEVSRDRPDLATETRPSDSDIGVKPTNTSKEIADTPVMRDAVTGKPVTPDVQPERPNLDVRGGRGETAQSANSASTPTGEEAILAPLRDGRAASDRAPGELLRGDLRDARRAGAQGADMASAKSSETAKSATASASGEAKPAVQGASPAASPTPAALQPATFLTMPAFEVLLAQMELASNGQLDEGGLDPVLSKSDGAFDPSALRLDARTEMRTASTLQFARGPRLTPQSAQTMAAQIAQRFNEGSRVFDIRMDPPELGRVEVRLEVGKDNSVRAVLSAERAETLAELQRSARELERALSEAGLDVGEDALSFSLSDESGLFNDSEGRNGPETPVFTQSEQGLQALDAPIGPLSTYGFLLARAEGLDVSV